MEPVARSYSAELNEALGMVQGPKKDEKLVHLINQFLPQNELDSAWKAAKNLSPEERPKVYRSLVSDFSKRGEIEKAGKVADRLFGVYRWQAYQQIIRTLISEGKFKEARKVYFTKYIEVNNPKQICPEGLFKEMITGLAQSCAYEETLEAIDLEETYLFGSVQAALEGFRLANHLDDALRLLNERQSRFDSNAIADLVTNLICSHRDEDAFRIIDRIDEEKIGYVIYKLQINFSFNKKVSALSRLAKKLPKILDHPSMLNLFITIYQEEGKSDSALTLLSGESPFKIDRPFYMISPVEFQKSLDLITEQGVVFAKQGDLQKVKDYVNVLYSLACQSENVARHILIRVAYVLSRVKLKENINSSPLKMLIAVIPESILSRINYKMHDLYYHISQFLQEGSHPYYKELKAELIKKMPENYRPYYEPIRKLNI